MVTKKRHILSLPQGCVLAVPQRRPSLGNKKNIPSYPAGQPPF